MKKCFARAYYVCRSHSEQANLQRSPLKQSAEKNAFFLSIYFSYSYTTSGNLVGFFPHACIVYLTQCSSCKQGQRPVVLLKVSFLGTAGIRKHKLTGIQENHSPGIPPREVISTINQRQISLEIKQRKKELLWSSFYAPRQTTKSSMVKVILEN